MNQTGKQVIIYLPVDSIRFFLENDEVEFSERIVSIEELG